MSEETRMIAEQTTYNFDKSTDHYDDSVNNYVIPRELTVTITLNEYRSLLQKEAKEEVHKATMEGYEKDRKIKELEEKVKHLSDVVETLKTMPCKSDESEV